MEVAADHTIIFDAGFSFATQGGGFGHRLQSREIRLGFPQAAFGSGPRDRLAVHCAGQGDRAGQKFGVAGQRGCGHRQRAEAVRPAPDLDLVRRGGYRRPGWKHLVADSRAIPFPGRGCGRILRGGFFEVTDNDGDPEKECDTPHGPTLAGGVGAVTSPYHSMRVRSGTGKRHPAFSWRCRPRSAGRVYGRAGRAGTMVVPVRRRAARVPGHPDDPGR